MCVHVFCYVALESSTAVREEALCFASSSFPVVTSKGS